MPSLVSRLLILCLLTACGGYVGFGWGYRPCCTYSLAAAAPYTAAVAEFDVGGTLDVVVAAEADGRAYLLRGMGGGRFEDPPAPVLSGLPPRPHVLAGQFDGDPHTDLVVFELPGSGFSLHLGDGTGAFTPRVVPAPPPPTPVPFVQMRTGLVDGDPFNDLVVLDPEGAFHVYVATGVGSFARVPGGPTPARPVGSPRVVLGADGLLFAVGPFDAVPGDDLLVLDTAASELRLLSGDQAGAFTPTFTATGWVLPGLLDVVAVRDDATGIADAAVLYADATRGVVVRKLDTHDADAWQLSATPSPAAPTVRVATGDLSGDGFADLIVASSELGELLFFEGSPR